MNPSLPILSFAQRDALSASFGVTRGYVDDLVDGSNMTPREKKLAEAFLNAVALWLDCEGRAIANDETEDTNENKA
jgi:hypothetical protein